MASAPIARREAGFGLVEIMVGVSIGLLALLIIYQGLALSEGYRRATTAGGDAQSTGMISSFLISQDIANAGNTLADTASDLINCPTTANFATMWRPIPVLITDGGSDDASDAIGVFYGVNRRTVTPVDTRVNAPAGQPFVVQSPLAWTVNDRFIVTNAIGPRCEMAIVTAIAGPNANGEVTLSVAPGAITQAYPQPSWLVNLGPANLVRKVTYDVNAESLRVTNLFDPPPAVPNPIASHVVLMKAQYGIDTSVPPDGTIDAWMSARNPPWTEADVRAAPIAQLRQIKAVRIALVIRSNQFERAKDAEGRDAVTDLTSDFTTTLFACNGLPGCTGEVGPVTFPNTANYRYRVYEQVVPLRNQIWNP